MILVVWPAHFFICMNDRPPKKAIKSMPAMIAAIKCCGIIPSLDVSIANSVGYMKNVNMRRNIAIMNR